MRLTTKILLSIAAGSIVPLVALGGVMFYQQTRIVTELAFAHAETQADIFANTITVEPPLSSTPLYRQLVALQDYVERLHADQGLDIVIVDHQKHILADVIEANIGTVFSHDQGDEIRQTIMDGRFRHFTETSVDYPQGIDIVVAPLKVGKPSNFGAVLLETKAGKEDISEILAENIANFIATPPPGWIPSIFENPAALQKFVTTSHSAHDEGKFDHRHVLAVIDFNRRVLASSQNESVNTILDSGPEGEVDHVLRDGKARYYLSENPDRAHDQAKIVVPVRTGTRTIGAVVMDADGSEAQDIAAAQQIAAFFAHSIALTPAQRASSLFGSQNILQEYVLDFHTRQQRDMVVVDHDKIILADVISQNLRTAFDHDEGDEVRQTILDGVPRTFVEKSGDYPQGIQQAVVPVKDQEGAILGAVILEFSAEYETALATLFRTGWVIAGLILGLTLVVVLVGYRTGLSISGPVRHLEATAASLAEGNLAQRAEVTSQDEVGSLARVFNNMAAQLAKSRDELEQRVEERTAELRTAQAELVRKERLAAVGQVTATVSHELRNPLGAIRNGIDAVKKFVGDENPQMTRAIALIDRSQDRCDKIIADLLSFTRIRQLKREVTLADVWLEDLLQEVRLPPGVTLECHLDSGSQVALDRDRMYRVVRNVIDNACHAMENDEVESPDKGHHLTVATRVADGRLELSVTDSGSGITPEVMAKIFEPLYSTKSFGVGLGLPMVKQIVEQHGGVVEIKSESGQGTRVALWLPLEEVERETLS